MKKALITGITGQDGHFLTALLLSKGYDVHGLVRRNSQMQLGTLEHLPATDRARVKIHWGDLLDDAFVNQLVRTEAFDEIYHFASQSFVGLSFENPRATYDVNIGGTVSIVHAVKEHRLPTRIYFAATSELFGKAQAVPQNERTSFYPRSPYAVSKLAGFWTIKNYREAYGIYATNGILYNHESEYRGPEFVTRKMTIAAARLSRGDTHPLKLGRLDAARDWGYAGDYVEGMWRMLQQPTPDDYVLATGVTHTVRAFADQAFRRAGIPLRWEGSGLQEVGRHADTGAPLIQVDPAFFRPSEGELLVGDASHARQVLDWRPTLSFGELVNRMVDKDLARLSS